MADEPKKQQAELREYEFPWYRRAGHALTDLLYGENARPEQGAWVQKLTGPENPFNFPAQITHGGENVLQGYRSGDPLLMGAGALEAGLASVIPAYAGFSVGAAPFRAYAARRAAKDAAEAAKGPWGNPGMLDEHLDQQAVTPRHELNQPKEAPKRMRGYAEMNAERDALEEEAIRFMLPGRGQQETLGDVMMGPDGQYYGRMEPRGSDGHRWWYAPNPIENYQAADKAWNDYHRYAGYGGFRPRPPEPLQGLADDVMRFGRNNENVPGVYEQAEALAQRVRGIDAAQEPEREAIRKQYANWDNVTGFGYNRNLFKGVEDNNPGVRPNQIGDYERHSHRYLDDARKFTKGDDHYIGDGSDHNALRRILVDEFGADPNDAQSIERAYQAFWAQEHARRAAGQRTIHDEERMRGEWEERNWLRERYGSGYTDEEYDAMARRDLEVLRKAVAEAREGAEARMSGDSGSRMERNPTMRGIADSVFRYGPPAAIGSYVAHRLGLGEREPPEEGTSSHFVFPKSEELRAPIPPAVPDSDYLKFKVNSELDDAKSDAGGAALRELLHAAGVPMSLIGLPGWWKVPGAMSQAYWLSDAIADRRRAKDREQTWKAQKQGYVDRLPELDPDTYAD